MKRTVIVILIVIFLCGCSQNGSNGAIPENSFDWATESQIEHALEIVQEMKDAVSSVKETEDTPPQSFINQAKDKMPLSKAMLYVDIEPNPEVMTENQEEPQKTFVSVTYINKLWGSEDEFIKYKNYEIAYFLSIVYEKIPEIDEAEVKSRGLTISYYSFGDQTLVAMWTFVPENQKMYVQVNIELDTQRMMGTIMYVNNETEMTQKLAKQLYEDFQAISLTDLKSLDKQASND